MPNDLLTDLLRDVSRSFYLTLRVLPASIRPQVALAYLLARATDTVADTELVPLERRLELLNLLHSRIQGSSQTRLDFGDLAKHQGSDAERVLLQRSEDALALLETLSNGDRQLIRDVLNTIISGQELDLRRFDGASASRIVALQTAGELDDYTYRVAGCVGEFWTHMCRAHVFPRAAVDDAFLLRNGVRFGKGLQLVNILRDLPADLRKGRCYLPAQILLSGGLKTADLLEPGNEARLRPVYNEHLDHAADHLDAGWVYTNALPWRAARVRLACAWPILIGVQTIKRLRTRNMLDPEQRIKIERGDVRKILFQSVLLYPWPGAWKRLAER